MKGRGVEGGGVEGSGVEGGGVGQTLGHGFLNNLVCLLNWCVPHSRAPQHAAATLRSQLKHRLLDIVNIIKVVLTFAVINKQSTVRNFFYALLNC